MVDLARLVGVMRAKDVQIGRAVIMVAQGDIGGKGDACGDGFQAFVGFRLALIRQITGDDDKIGVGIAVVQAGHGGF